MHYDFEVVMLFFHAILFSFVCILFCLVFNVLKILNSFIYLIIK